MLYILSNLLGEATTGENLKWSIIAVGFKRSEPAELLAPELGPGRLLVPIPRILPSVARYPHTSDRFVVFGI